MMMAQKYLHELLKEDQEPFLVKNYIAHRRCQLKTLSPKILLQLKKRKTIVESSTTNSSLCSQACFFSFQDSPDFRKSPIPDFLSPAKSPCKSPNTVFLHIPARTAALLLEAAIRIQKQSSSSLKSKTQIKNAGFGLFSSILKRLKDRSRTKKLEINDNGFRVSANNSRIASRKSNRNSMTENENVLGVDEKSACEMDFSCSCNHIRLSGAGLPQSNEETRLDLETSSSCCRSENFEEIEFITTERVDDGGSPSCAKHFRSSLFPFSPQKSPSFCHRAPDLLSPPTSPSRHTNQEKENYEGEGLQEIQVGEEEEKEQSSPVSVLDPPFEEDDDGHEGEDDAVHEGGEEEDDYDLECSSYAIIQRSKQQLLHRLCRFEKLAKLDPIELERSMLVDEEEEEENLDEEFVRDISNRPGSHHLRKNTLDLILKEKKEENGLDNYEIVAKRICKKLESNTTNMIIELDLRNEVDGWTRYLEQVGEIAMKIELAIFGLLVEELSQEFILNLDEIW